MLLQHEIAALRRIAAHDDALTQRGCAYGYGGDELLPDGGKQYPFEIAPDGLGQLRLTIDGYDVLGMPQGDAFDDAKWQDMQVTLNQPADRAGYRALALAGRHLVRGNTVNLGNSTRVKLSWLLMQPRKDAPWYLED